VGGEGWLDERDVAVDANAWRMVTGQMRTNEEEGSGSNRVVPRSCQCIGCAIVAASILSASASAVAAADEGMNHLSRDTMPAKSVIEALLVCNLCYYECASAATAPSGSFDHKCFSV
jgi:hypothetical protein